MGFATRWLEEKALFPELFYEKPDNKTAIIVVVPAFNEPGITTLLDSLGSCEKPDCEVEVLIIVNARHDADSHSIQNNQLSVKNIETWKAENKTCFFRVFVFDAGQPEIGNWGVGLARKTGMDEALRRFSLIDKPDGLIACLDADCKTEKNYFVSILKGFHERNRSACSIYFEHPLTGIDYPRKNYKIITDYELHLRYYLQALKYTGFPYAFHTVGSSMALRASQYMKSGGMNRRLAGEDFYFIQKLVQLGGYFYLNTTTVYPSPRASVRVPFGTGTTISRLINNNDEQFMTYNIDSFNCLRQIFHTVGSLFKADSGTSEKYFLSLPSYFRTFTDRETWISKIGEINENTSVIESFLKRFFNWFNMFKIVKYLNHVHNDIYTKQPVTEAALSLLKLIGYEPEKDNPYDLLIFMRSLEKNGIK
jgi:hypothetical protein